MIFANFEGFFEIYKIDFIGYEKTMWYDRSVDVFMLKIVLHLMLSLNQRND